jgi:hypothetical protein
MVMRIIRWVSMFAFLALMSGPTSSQPAPSEADWINALHSGGFVIVFRHGATYQDQADTDPLNPKNVGQQRQLNDDGRTLAKSIGESLSKLRIPVGQVHTSLFQRAIDTGAMMGFGEVRTSVEPDGNGGYKPIVRIQAGAWSELAKDADSFLNLYDLN